jgi:hypothetical protein
MTFKFIREHRKEIDEFILTKNPGFKINDEERRMWVENDEGLYNWARSERRTTRRKKWWEL